MGLFVSFEGGDGAGKGTQSRLLETYLREQGAEVKLEGFPRYTGPVGWLIGNYLNGVYGEGLHSDIASAPYTLDRLSAKDEILEYTLAENGVYLADRFSDSNKGHQGGKLKTNEERTRFFKAQDDFEHVALGIPKPDKTILLPVPAKLAQTYVDLKNARSYTSKGRDMHEADPNHLQNAYEAYLLLAEQNPERIIVIDPVDKSGEAMRPIDEIHKDIIKALRPILEERLSIFAA
ncbi:MAG: dTMP kinase [Candidatus Saccharimonadaceae bacterium]